MSVRKKEQGKGSAADEPRPRASAAASPPAPTAVAPRGAPPEKRAVVRFPAMLRVDYAVGDRAS